MLYSTERIMTTHAGSLPRPADLRDLVVAKANGAPHDAEALGRRLKSAVAEAVRRQAECGLDCVNDGELSKTNFTDYVRWRIAGYVTRPSADNAGLRREIALYRPG
jgi:5-methyltetrahydropteroyltriglutamate--homocysteine methyltransferase